VHASAENDGRVHIVVGAYLTHPISPTVSLSAGTVSIALVAGPHPIYCEIPIDLQHSPPGTLNVVVEVAHRDGRPTDDLRTTVQVP